ncbi:MAG: helix-turn-helix domain-containing protein [Candidatus Bathyarchaeia archaeon]
MSWEAELDGLKLGTAAFKVLSYLTFRGAALKPSQIAKGTNLKPSTVRARLAEMKDKGLVTQNSAGYISAVNPYDILMKLYRVIKKESGV